MKTRLTSAMIKQATSEALQDLLDNAQRRHTSRKLVQAAAKELATRKLMGVNRPLRIEDYLE